MGPVVRMARPENPNEIDEFVNPLCTELDEIGSFQSYCIGHFEQEWVDGLGQMIAEGRVPLTEAPRVEDPTEMRHMNGGYIQQMEFSRLDRTHFYADAVIYVEGRFCINTVDYVRRDKEGKPYLTEFARSHTEACCLRFDRVGR